MTWKVKWHVKSNDMKSQMIWNLNYIESQVTRNLKWNEIWNDMISQMTLNPKWHVITKRHEISNDLKLQMTWNLKWVIISKTSGTDAVCAKKTIPQMRFHQVLTLWTCFPCMFDMSTMLKLCWNWFWAFWDVSSGHFLKLLPTSYQLKVCTDRKNWAEKK